MEGEHFFELHTFGNFTHCHYCHKMLWGLRKQGYKCKYCGYAAHKKCLVDIARTAPACPRNPVIQRYFTAPSPVAAAASAPPPPPLYPSAAASYEVPTYVPPPPPPMPSYPRSGGRGALLGDIQHGTRLRRVDRPPSPPPLLGLRPAERRSRVQRPPSPLVSPEMRSNQRRRSLSPSSSSYAAPQPQHAVPVPPPMPSLPRGSQRRRSLSPSSSSHAVPVPPPMPPEPYSSRRRQQQRHTFVSGSGRGALLSAIRDRRNVQRLRRTPVEPDGFVRAGGSAHERRHSMTGGAGEQARLFPAAAAAEAADPPAWRNRSTSMSTLVQPPEFAAAAAAAAEEAEEIRRVLVNYDYQATTDVELTVQAGMELDVTAKQEGWIHVVDGPRSGWIPRSYTETIDPPRSGLRLAAAAAAAAPSAEPAASSEADPLRHRQNKKWGIATMSWIASESDELSVHSGAKLELLSEDDGGWIMCKTSDGQSGLLPSLCVNPRTEAEMAARALAVSMGRTIAADTRAPPLIAVSEPPAATTPVAAPAETPTPAQDPDDLCKICMDAKVDVVILWCGHVAICSSCARFLKKCPICRQAIFKIQKIYRA